MNRFVFSMLLAVACAAQTTATVCSSGCTYTTIQAALDATPANCSITAIEITAGQTFAEEIRVPFRPCNSTVHVRSSRWRELPAGRVSEADAALMPRISSISGGYPVVQFGWDEFVVTGQDNATDQIFVGYGSYYTLLVDGVAVAFRRGNVAGDTNTKTPLPTPLISNQKYFLRGCAWNGSAYACQVSETKTGPVLDIGGAGDYSTFSSLPRGAIWDNPNKWRWTGIEIRPDPTHSKDTALQIGGLEPAGFVSDIWIDRCLIRGQQTAVSPRRGIAIHGQRIKVSGSWIGHIWGSLQESTGFSLGSSPGPVVIDNNYISAASIGILTGGQGLVPEGQMATDISITRNTIHKMGYYLYSSGTVAPTGACWYDPLSATGAVYRNTTVAVSNCSGGGCYRCQSDSTWIEDTSLFYRLSFATKGGIEFKNCRRCAINGNIIDTTFAAESNTDAAFLVVQNEQGGYISGNWDIDFRNNWMRNVFDGMWLTAAADPWVDQSNWTIDNNVITGQQRTLQQDLSSGPEGYLQIGLRTFAKLDGLYVTRNTFRPNAGTTSSFYGWNLDGGSMTGAFQSVGILKNNILAATYTSGGLLSSENANTCGPPGMLSFMADDAMTNNAMFGASANLGSSTGCIDPKSTQATDAAMSFAGSDFSVLASHKLTAASPYSAANGSPTMLASTGATLGADIDGIQSAVTNYADTIRLTAVRSASNTITLRFDDAAAECTVGLFSDFTRLTSVGAGSSSVSGSRRTVTWASQAGQRWYSISCSGGVAVGSL